MKMTQKLERNAMDSTTTSFGAPQLPKTHENDAKTRKKRNGFNNMVTNETVFL